MDIVIIIDNRGGWNKDVLGGKKIEKLTIRGGRLFGTREYCGAKSTKGSSFPRRMIIDGQEIFDQGKIANCFNKFFVDIGPKLASMIPESQTKFDHYLNP